MDLLTAVLVDQSADGMPFLGRAETIGQFEQRHLAFIADDTVHRGDQRESLFGTETGEMAAHREMARDAIVPQIVTQLAEAIDIELENQGESDHDRVERLGRAQNLRAIQFEIE